MIILHLLIIKLIGTVVIESFFAFLLGIRNKHDHINIVLANIMTNPLLVILTFTIKAKYGNDFYFFSLLTAEIMAVTGEGFLYKSYLKYNRIGPFLLSMILNAASCFIDLLVTYI